MLNPPSYHGSHLGFVLVSHLPLAYSMPRLSRFFFQCIHVKWNPEIEQLRLSWFALRTCSVKISTGKQVLLIEGVRGIPQIVQANICIVPYIGHDRFLPLHFQSVALKSGSSPELWCLRYWHLTTNHKNWGEVYTFSCSALCYFILPRISYSLLNLNILLSSLFSSIPSLCALSSRWETKFLAVETNNCCLLSSVNYSEETH
jgi:hypothetical protein